LYLASKSSPLSKLHYLIGDSPIVLDVLYHNSLVNGKYVEGKDQDFKKVKPSQETIDRNYVVGNCYNDRVTPTKGLKKLARKYLKWKQKNLKGKSKYDVCLPLAEYFKIKDLIPSKTWDEWRDEKKNYTQSVCINDTDYITQEEWSKTSAPDMATIYQSEDAKKGICYKRFALLKALKNNRVFRWTGPEGSACCRDSSVKYYHLPYPDYWIDQGGLNALEYIEWTRHFDLVLVSPRELVGTAFRIGALHGRAVPIYTLVPRLGELASP
jgi:hypothetical protein